MLRFFNYYGSKMRIAKHYSKPRHVLVIEPFAGSESNILVKYHLQLTRYPSVEARLLTLILGLCE